MATQFYLLNHDNDFIVIDAMDHSKYHFTIRNRKLYYLYNDQEWLVITHVIQHIFSQYKLNVLTAYDNDPHNQSAKRYEIESEYISDPKYDAMLIEDYRDGLFLPQNPFAIDIDNTGTGVKKIRGDHGEAVRCRLFYDLIINYLKESTPCQDCGQSFSKNVYRNHISFELHDYQMRHQCVFCATKEDNIFEVYDFTIKDGDTLYEFFLEDHKLYLKSDDRKLLVYTRDIEESISEPPDSDGLDHLLVQIRCHPVVVVKDQMPFERPTLGHEMYFRGSVDERIIPENPTMKVHGLKKFEYFIQTLERLIHCQPCIDCGKTRTLAPMSLKADKYYLHGRCYDCLSTIVDQKTNQLFEYQFEGNIMIIKDREIEQSYEFVVKDNKAYFNDKLLMILEYQGQTMLRCFDLERLESAVDVNLTNTGKETYGSWNLLKYGNPIGIPNRMVPLELSLFNLKDNVEVIIELPYSYFFNRLLKKIVFVVPCQQCGEKKPLTDRKSFISLHHGCYYLDSKCKECWTAMF